MIKRSFIKVILVAFTLLLAGCAEQRGVFKYVEAKQDVVWPQAPETPRFQYLGQLTGENNFVPDESQFQNKAIQVLKWIVGLMSSKRVPVVLQRPQSVVVSDDGRIFVTDVSRQAVYVFDRIDGRLKIWDASAKSKGFVAPIGIALADQGDILVTDAELRIVVRLDKNGDPKSSIGHESLKRPTGIARDPDTGYIYVSDTQDHNIKVFNDSGELLDVFGKRGDSAGEFNAPTHLSIFNRHLYITDSLNSRIQVLSLEGDYAKEFGKRGLFIGDLPHPKGISVDHDGNIYVVESYFDHLLVYNSEGDLLLPIGGTGKGIGEFYLPAGVTVDKYDRVYVSDMFNGRIQVFQYLGSGEPTVPAGAVTTPLASPTLPETSMPVSADPVAK